MRIIICRFIQLKTNWPAGNVGRGVNYLDFLMKIVQMNSCSIYSVGKRVTHAVKFFGFSYRLQGALLGRHVIRLATSSPMKRSACGSHFNGLLSSIAILPR